MKKLIKIVAILMVVGLSSINAKDIKYTENIEIAYDAKGKAIGKILPLVELEVLKKVGDMYQVQINGFVNPSSKSAMYLVAGKRILVAGFSKPIEGKALNTDKATSWVKTQTVVYIKTTSILNASLDDLLAKAKSLYRQNCGACHGVHPADQFTANQWPSIVKAMIGRTALNKNQQWFISEYLQRNASDMKK